MFTTFSRDNLKKIFFYNRAYLLSVVFLYFSKKIKVCKDIILSIDFEVRKQIFKNKKVYSLESLNSSTDLPRNRENDGGKFY